jgi:imidazolonepropionase-like amidohydrolase
MLLLLACRPEPAQPPAPEPEPAPVTGDFALTGVTALDAQGARGPVTVVWSGEVLVAVVPDGAWLDVGEVIEAPGAWVLPGLIDPHVHLLLSGAPWWVGDTLEGNLRATLAAGVTTVADVGGPMITVALRDRIAAGEIVGPQVLALGPMVTALGSHPCETLYDPDWCTFASTEAEGAQAAEARTEARTDGVKLALADASFTPWPTPRLTLEAATAAVSSPGYALAHVDTAEDVELALQAGVDQLAHPVFGDVLLPPTLDAVVSAGVSVHTTLGAFAGTGEVLAGALPEEGVDPRVVAAWRWVAEHPEALDPAWVSGASAWTAEAERSLLALLGASVPLLPASDAGYFYVPHGLGLHLELERLAALGFDPESLIVAATAGNAASLGLSDRGRLSPGQRADLIVVDADPRVDLGVLRVPRQVVRGGEVAGGEVLAVARQEPPGTFCLDARDCDSGACDQVTHRCVGACPDCGPAAWCAPADGVDAAPVCRTVRPCDLYAPVCAPEPYLEACAPLDLDTSGCFPAGPRQDGQSCDPASTATACAPGLVCTLDDARCHRPCQSSSPACPHCEVISLGGTPWFGVCR